MAQDHGLCRKKKESTGTGARAATAGPCCSCQQDSSRSLQTAGPNMTILAHMEGTGANEAKQNELDGGKANLNGGKNSMRAVGMAGKGWQANTKPAEQGTEGRHSRQILRPAQASKQTATDGRPRSETTAADHVGSPSVQLGGGECSGTGSHEGGCRPTYTVLPHPSPLPVTVPTHSLTL